MSLDNATSPYLLSHKDNPVQWRTWGPQALAEAAAQDKPILLSLGYNACHWCHVMNREIFSDAETAALINENYIPILADRDERPDLDMLYQGAAGVMGHPGGWPLNIFLAPDGTPFWVTGYLTREDTGESPGFRRVLTETATLWKNERARVDDGCAKVRAAVENLYNRDMSAGPESINLDISALRIGQRYDLFFGGMQGPTKFPNAMLLDVLWRAFLRTGTPQFSQLIFTTLDGILFGGLYDHIGGGFFRHCMDERWFEPSFEKMLYDQALLIDVCTQIWQFNRNELCRQRLFDTVAFLLRDMKVGDAFASCISSGSQTEDAKYYTWSEPEIDAALAGTFSARFKQVYGITRDGNMLGRNLPRRLGNPAPASDADEALLAKQRELLLAGRAKRTAPMRDDRVVASWNGLTIAALSRAGQVFDKPEWIAAAIKAFDAVVKTLGGDAGSLSHQQGSMGIADDYADMARAALQLREVTGDDRFLVQARAWTATLNDHFWNNQINGYCFYADNAEQLFVRPRMLFDNPTPSANGTMLTVLTRLAMLTGERDYMGRASVLANTFGNEANRALNGAGSYLAGFECLLNSLIILVVGHKGHTKTQELIRAYWGKPVPNGLLVQIEPGDVLPADHPALGRGMQGGHPTAYICQAGTCSDGIINAADLTWALTLPAQLRAQQPPAAGRPAKDELAAGTVFTRGPVMIKAIRFEKTGGSDVLQYVDYDLPPPARGQVQVKHAAIGVNFIDTYHRTGLYTLPLPSGLGSEAAGTVAALGEGVTQFQIGDRVGYSSGAIGSYAQANNVPAQKLVKLPDGISDELAAAILLKGMTAQYLLRQIHPVKAGETIVFHAAAGGVGQIGCQWAKHLGATVIGTTTSPAKIALATANGCAHVLNSHDAGWEKKVREITGGAGVPVVYDSIGKDTFMAGLDCLSPRGIMVTYGNASGPVDPFSPSILAAKGSLFVTRPTLNHYTSTHAELQACADDLFAVILSGAVKVAINQRLP